MTNLSDLRRQLKNKVRKVSAKRERRLFVLTVNKNLKATVEKLIGLEGYSHLSTITGVDFGPKIEVIYHIVFKDALISLRVQVPKKKPVLPTIIDLVPGAGLYEREIHDLFGVTFEGNQDLSPLLLPDRWPSDVYPLRKEWTREKISKRIGGR